LNDLVYLRVEQQVPDAICTFLFHDIENEELLFLVGCYKASANSKTRVTRSVITGNSANAIREALEITKIRDISILDNQIDGSWTTSLLGYSELTKQSSKTPWVALDKARNGAVKDSTIFIRASPDSILLSQRLLGRLCWGEFIAIGALTV
jgi:hypothetical protein